MTTTNGVLVCHSWSEVAAAEEDELPAPSRVALGMAVNYVGEVRRLALLVLLSCGRSTLVDEQAPEPLVMTRESPLVVFKVTDRCPGKGAESDLVPSGGDSLVLARTIAQGECSGAGGDWLIGREDGAARDLHMGAHACFFIPHEFSSPTPVRWGVARTLQTAGLSSTPKGWCVRDLDGREPVSSAVVVRAWALYPSEAGARAALAALKR